MPMNTNTLRPRRRKLLLDLYPSAEAAYSLRLIRRGYTGPVVRVRSSGSGSPEQDFYAHQITDGTLTSFCGANNGHVTTWYDQSGLARHALQGTAANQPLVVTSGILDVDNVGKPVVKFRGTESLVGAVLSGVFILQVVKYTTSGPSVYNSLSTRVASSSGFSFDNQVSHFARAFGSVSNVGLQSALSSIVKTLLTFRAVDSNFGLFANGTSVASSGTNIGYVSQSTQALSIGYSTGNSGGVAFEGQFSEIIIYGTDRTNQRLQIEADIRRYYSL